MSFCAMTFSSTAQLPSIELYMFNILNNGKTISLKNPTYLSDFNPNGYNNQPSFMNPRDVIITSNVYDKDFTDFIKLDLSAEKYYRITATDSISEYSPTVDAPDRSFSAVRVEKDGVTQSLWLYPDNHNGYGQRVLSDIGNVGYHLWLNTTEVALFLVDNPMKMALADIETGEVNIIGENIGRCFKKGGLNEFYYVEKSDADWSIKKYNTATSQSMAVIKTLAQSEDYDILNDGTFIMGQGSKLYKFHPEKDKSWIEVGDLSEYGISEISRITSSRNKLILVNNPS